MLFQGLSQDCLNYLGLLAVGVAAGAVNVGLLRHAGVQVVGLVGAVQVFVPQQGAARPLLGFQRRFITFNWSIYWVASEV